MSEHTISYFRDQSVGGTVVVCSCGWRSKPVRAHLLNATTIGHLKAVSTDE